MTPHDTPPASAFTAPSDALEAGFVTLRRAGQPIPTYFAVKRPNSAAPVVLVIHEIWGVDARIQEVCRRLAREGYFALAPYLYSRQGDVTNMQSVEAILALVRGVPDQDALADLDSALAWAKRQEAADASRSATLGFGWGGKMVWLYANHNADLKCGVALYGPLREPTSSIHPVSPLDVAGALRVPVLGIYAGCDSHIPVADVRKLEETLSRLPSGSVISMYAEARHGFFADNRGFYDENSAKQAWSETLLWFDEHGLGNDTDPEAPIAHAEVRNTFARFVGALEIGDLSALENLCSDNCLLVHPDGQTLTKTQIMGDFRQHAVRFTSFETEHVAIKTLGRVGILTVEIRNTFLRDGKAGAMHATQVVIFVKSGQDVTITHLQSTNIPDGEP